MKAFITGGAGFIGSFLIKRLISEGNHVTVYDNLSSGCKEYIFPYQDLPLFKFIKADLLDIATLKKAILGHDQVFHLAANPEARWGIENTELDLKQETIATYHVLEAMRVNSIKKIVFSSSGTIYGETPVIPLPEDYGPVLPISLYGAGKLASEGLISAFCNTFGMKAWIYRFANVVGPRMTHGIIFDFIKKLNKNPLELEILGDGRQAKPYLYVEECIDGILFGLNNANERVNVYNLGCTSVTDVTSIARMLVSEMGLTNVKFNYSGGDRGWPGDVPQVRYNVDKMLKLGWKVKYTSDEAVAKAIKTILGKS